MAEARYLRVKNWGEFQHYRNKEPKWIKLYGKLLSDGRFVELDEAVQWQLVRLWMVASQADRFTRDENDRRVPVIAYDEKGLRRAIGTLKKIPLEKFVADGWLVVVTEQQLETVRPEPHTDPSDDDNNSRASLDRDYSESSSLLEVESRGLELASASQGSTAPSTARIRRLPNEHMLDKLMQVVAASADPATRDVFAAYARQLPDSSLAKVIESTARQPAAIRAKYANGALQSELSTMTRKENAA